MSASLSVRRPDAGTVQAVSPVDLSEVERAILNATVTNSLSLLAIAEHVGMGSNPVVVLPVVERLEQLDLLNGHFAAGRVMAASTDVHRRYYRVSERGRRFV